MSRSNRQQQQGKERGWLHLGVRAGSCTSAKMLKKAFTDLPRADSSLPVIRFTVTRKR